MIKINLDRAKQITHEIRRETRAKEFAPHDEVIMKQIPSVDHEQAEQSRAEIRERHAKLQQDIDACDTPEQLEQIINNLQSK